MISQAINAELREQLLKECERELARRRLFDFISYTMEGYRPNWHHRLICNKIDKVVSGETKRLILSAPPQHFKSEIVSRRLPPYVFGRLPNAKVISCSYNSSLATTFNRDVQRIMTSEEYLELFPASAIPSKRVKHASENAKLRNTETFELLHHNGSYYCSGTDGGISGRGYHLGIIDDPIKGAKEAFSPAVRANIKNWYDMEFRVRLNKWEDEHGDLQEARIIIMMTRWHPDDLVGRILDIADKSDEADQWEVLSLPGLKEAGGHPEDPRKPGEALWPSEFDEKFLRAVEEQSANGFAALYQQDPKRAIVSEWPPRCFGSHIWFQDWPAMDDCRICALDPSKGKGSKYSDYAALIKVGRSTEDGRFYVEADLWNNRDARQLSNEIIYANEQFQPAGFALESVLFQELFADIVMDQCDREGLGRPPIQMFNHTQPKELRIRRLAGDITSDNIRVKDTPGGRLLVKQLSEFPLSDHDDGPDALEMGIRLYKSMNAITIDDGLGDNLLASVM
jgi:predicted phage terminase large subunit-like protein